jgi:type II secretory pathway component GspD/PulD (secretin)
MVRALLLCGLLLGSTACRAEDEVRLIGLSVTIVSSASEKLRSDLSAEEAAKVVAELAKAGELTSHTRLQFTAVENQQVRFQFGESLPVVSGRTFPGGGRGNPPPGFPAAMNTFTVQPFGTLVEATARITDRGVLANLQLEQSKLAPKPAGEDNAAEPPGTSTLTFKSTVLIPAGQTLVLAGFYDKQTANAPRTLLLVRATVPEGGKAARAEQPVLKIFSLKNVKVDAAQDILRRVFDNPPLQLGADERNNSLTIRGSVEQLAEVEALLRELDGPAK